MCAQMMKAALLRGPQDVVLEEVPVPSVTDKEVLVEVKFCGICGTDVHSYETASVLRAGTYLGHEFSGIIAETGKDVKNLKVGDRVTVCPWYMCGECVACRHGFPQRCLYGHEKGIGGGIGRQYAGGFARFVKIPEPNRTRLFCLPLEVSFEEGAMVEPLAVAIHAIRTSAIKPGNSVAVLGVGPIGLGVVAFLRATGAGLIISTYRSNEFRAELAKKLGADHTISVLGLPNIGERVLELTDGLGVDVIFECSGVGEALVSALGFLKPGGQIILLGSITTPVEIIPFDFIPSELRVQGSNCYHYDEFPIAIDFLRRGLVNVSEMITSKINLENIVEGGFKRLLKPGHQEIKVLVSP